MSTPESFCKLIQFPSRPLNQEEIMLLEIELFHHIIKELKSIFINHYKDYFRLLKFTHEMENSMIENHFIRYIINDILSTEEYSIAGIAYYTQIPEEVIFEIATGLQDCLSFSLSQKIIELHRMVRSELYKSILQKYRNKVMSE